MCIYFTEGITETEKEITHPNSFTRDTLWSPGGSGEEMHILPTIKRSQMCFCEQNSS